LRQTYVRSGSPPGGSVTVRRRSLGRRVLESLGSGFLAEVVEAFRRQWKWGILAGLGLTVVLFLVAYFS